MAEVVTIKSGLTDSAQRMETLDHHLVPGEPLPRSGLTDSAQRMETFGGARYQGHAFKSGLTDSAQRMETS